MGWALGWVAVDRNGSSLGQGAAQMWRWKAG